MRFLDLNLISTFCLCHSRQAIDDTAFTHFKTREIEYFDHNVSNHFFRNLLMIKKYQHLQIVIVGKDKISLKIV